MTKDRGVKSKLKDQIDDDQDVSEDQDVWEERRNEFNEVYWYNPRKDTFSWGKKKKEIDI